MSDNVFECGHPVTVTSAVALAASDRYKIRAQRAKGGKSKTSSLSLFLEMKDMDVDHVLATNSAAAWASIRGDEKKCDEKGAYNEKRGQWRGMLRLGKLGLVTS